MFLFSLNYSHHVHQFIYVFHGRQKNKHVCTKTYTPRHPRSFATSCPQPVTLSDQTVEMLVSCQKKLTSFLPLPACQDVTFSTPFQN